VCSAPGFRPPSTRRLARRQKVVGAAKRIVDDVDPGDRDAIDSIPTLRPPIARPSAILCGGDAVISRPSASASCTSSLPGASKRLAVFTTTASIRRPSGAADNTCIPTSIVEAATGPWELRWANFLQADRTRPQRFALMDVGNATEQVDLANHFLAQPFGRAGAGNIVKS